ncbi:MAG: hypothetical protein MRY64_16335 [Hyphomonadaceae bacterium]|nr:hypothetical protein [Hyphomonadaceae bacterium]
MTTTLPVFSPLSLYAVAAKAALDANTTMQKAAIDTLERVAQSDVEPITWVSSKVPVPNPDFYFNEDMLRDAFHGLADANLRAWGYAADTLKALPSWTSWPVKVPGSVMTDFFDQVRRNGMTFMPANDAWAVPKPAGVNFWAPVPEGPALLDAPTGEPDDLTQIKGIGAKLSAMLNDLGIYHFAQIAAWTEADGEWIDDKLAFKRRVARENWIEQAKALVAEMEAA